MWLLEDLVKVLIRHPRDELDAAVAVIEQLLGVLLAEALLDVLGGERAVDHALHFDVGVEAGGGRTLQRGAAGGRLSGAAGLLHRSFALRRMSVRA